MTETGSAAGPAKLEERLEPWTQSNSTETVPAVQTEPDDQFANVRCEHAVTESPQKAELRQQIADLNQRMEEAQKQLQERDAQIQERDAHFQRLGSWVGEEAASAVERGELLSPRLDSQTASGDRAAAELEALRKNPYVLLLSPLRRVHDLTSFVSSTIRSVQRVDVRKVLSAPKFKQKQRAYTRSVKAELEKRRPIMTIPGELLDDEEQKVNSEADLEKCLCMNVYPYLNKLSDNVQTGSVSRAGCSEITS